MSRNSSGNDTAQLIFIVLLLVTGAVSTALIARSLLKQQDEEDTPPVDFEADKRIKKFKTAIHAFMSLVSMEQIGCELLSPSDEGCYTCVTQDFDPGWNPIDFHEFFQTITAGINGLSPAARELLSIWQHHSQYSQKFLSSRNPHQHHLNLINQLFQQSNVVIYPWGAANHRVYIELFRIESNRYRIRIFDLGAGRQAIRADYQPIEYCLNLAEFSHRVLLLIQHYNAELTPELLARIYGTEESICATCVPEYAQTTGNCVVKNLLAAMQQDAVDRYGIEGLNVFSELYVALLQASLVEARQYAARQLVTELPHFNQLCALVEQRQVAFTGTARAQLQPIAELYQSVRALSAREPIEGLNLGVCTVMTASSSTFVGQGWSNDRDTGLRRHGQDRKDIVAFLLALENVLKKDPDAELPISSIPKSLQASFVDLHQEQHLVIGGRSGKSIFFPGIGTSLYSPVLNALACVVNKLVSEYCRRQKTAGATAKYQNFVVDFGFDIGILRGGRKDCLTSCIKIEGFSGQNYHIFPVEFPVERTTKAIIIDAKEMLGISTAVAASASMPRHVRLTMRG